MTEHLPPTEGILFLCVANSARSQMGEALARLHGPANLRIHSAGSQPTRIHPMAVKALADLGVDISAQRSKGIDEVPMHEIDLVITLCADEVCPVLPPGVRAWHWPLPDPAAAEGGDEEVLGSFVAVRDELSRRLRGLFDSAECPD
ncbi:MAG: arsenate reductase ArsC [Planctomycetota bacterium]|jgi:arsenate reductase